MRNHRFSKKSSFLFTALVGGLFGVSCRSPLSLFAANFAGVKLNVDVVAPDGLTINHTPKPLVYFSDYLTVSVTVAAPAGNGVSRILLHYRPQGRTDYTTATGANAFQPLPDNRRNYSGKAVIPGEVLRGGGVEYYIEAFDLSSRPSYKGTSAVPLVTRLDGGGIVTAAPYVLDMGPSGGTMILPDGDDNDGNTSLQISAGTLSNTTTFSITQKDKRNPAVVPPPSGKATGQAANAYSFTGGPSQFSPPVRISLLYTDIDENKGTVDGTSIDETLLRLFYWDGLLWRLVGGTVNPTLDTVSASVSKLGLFALFPISDLSSRLYAPAEKIVTPNGDGTNDLALFSGLSGDFEIRIFNEAGHLIRTIRDLAQWDGRDSSGNLVDNGLYLYQYRSELSDEWVSGLIAVAK